jgi:hypothetical protein
MKSFKLIALASLFALSACGDKAEDTAADDTAEAEEEEAEGEEEEAAE